MKKELKNGGLAICFGLEMACATIGATANAATYQVATPQALVDALEQYNGSGTDTIIELTAARYDMGTVGKMDDYSHLFAKKITIRGASSNPRETVIYGNRTARVFNLEGAKLYNLTVSNGVVAAGQMTGGVYAKKDSGAVCSNCVITCNSGNNGDNGGVSYATCRDCEICGNDSGHGAGAGYNTVYGGSIHGNTAARSGGGGIMVAAHGVKIYDNEAARGAGLSANGACTVNDCEIYNNRATGTDENYGGAVCCITAGSGNSFVMTNCQIYGNSSASYGGGGMNCKLVNCTVSNNTAVTAGGGAYKTTLVDSHIVKNVCQKDGAGLYSCTATGTLIAGNAIPISASNGEGGGAKDSALTNCVIRDNFAKVGAAMNGGSAYRCVITNNTSSIGTYTVRSTLKLEDCQIHAQHFDSPGSMLNCVISGGWVPVTLDTGANVYTSGTFRATELTSLINNTQPASMTATNCLFCGSRCSILIQGQQNTKDKRISLVNCTFADNHYNRTFCYCPGSSGVNGSMEFLNCIFGGNKRTVNEAAVSLLPERPQTDTQVYVSDCLVDAPPEATWQPAYAANIITNSAGFYGAGDHPYQLKRKSQARGKSAVMAWMSSANDIRGDGYPRLREGKADLGCYQCWLPIPGLVVTVQ